mgnify:CR=1 FL=1
MNPMDRLPINVSMLTHSQRERWDEFVHRCPQATFFHLSAWQDILDQVFDHRTFYLYAERAGDIVAVLPMAEVRSREFYEKPTTERKRKAAAAVKRHAKKVQREQRRRERLY